MIPPHFLSEVRDKLNLVDLIGRYVELKQSGANWFGLCPFPEHTDTSPSFSVHPTRGYYCFGCKRSGSHFQFLEQLHGITFPEAVKMAAEFAGIDFTFSTDTENSRDELLVLMKAATKHYYKALQAQPDRISYLTETRKITPETIQRYGLGYCDGTFAPTATESWDRGAIEESGLFYSFDLGYREIMFGRWTFPITNLSGRVVAMGGKAMEGTPPYRNTGESIIYHKGSMLYGLQQAKDYIRSMGWVLLVEGYFDVLQAAQNGFPNAVGICGTSFTESQAKLLKRLTNTVVILTDGDSAGRRAVPTVFANLWSGGIDHVKVGFCPEGLDPDDMFKADPAAGVKVVTSAQNYLNWTIPENMSSELQEKCILAMRALLMKVRTTSRREMLTHFIGRRLAVPEKLLHVDVPDEHQPEQKSVGTKAELMLLGSLLNEKPTDQQIPGLFQLEWSTPEIPKLIRHIIQLHTAGLSDDIKLAVYDNLPPEQTQLVAEAILMSEKSVKLMPALVLARNEHRLRKIKSLQEQIKVREQAGQNVAELFTEIVGLRDGSK